MKKENMVILVVGFVMIVAKTVKCATTILIVMHVLWEVS